MHNNAIMIIKETFDETCEKKQMKGYNIINIFW